MAALRILDQESDQSHAQRPTGLPSWAEGRINLDVDDERLYALYGKLDCFHSTLSQIFPQERSAALQDGNSFGADIVAGQRAKNFGQTAGQLFQAIAEQIDNCGEADSKHQGQGFISLTDFQQPRVDMMLPVCSPKGGVKGGVHATSCSLSP